MRRLKLKIEILSFHQYFILDGKTDYGDDDS